MPAISIPQHLQPYTKVHIFNIRNVEKFNPAANPNIPNQKDPPPTFQNRKQNQREIG